MTRLTIGAIGVEIVAALVDGEPSDDAVNVTSQEGITTLSVIAGNAAAPGSVGVRLRVRGAERYLRNGYHSWDGSYFVQPDYWCSVVIPSG